MADTAVVTGAFSYTGRAIAELLLARGTCVRTLSRAPGADPRIESFPFAFDDARALARSLGGARVLYNTYWVRFAHRTVTFERAIENTRVLLSAARAAGLERVVHVSVTNPSEDSPLPYFRGKAVVEREVRACGLDYGIVRPTLVFGPHDILLNNIAWILRRLPVFVVPGRGDYRVQPVSVEDTARICVEAGKSETDVVVDAAGPEVYTFAELVRLVGRAVGKDRALVRAPPWAAWALGAAIGVAVRDVLLTRDELAGLAASLLVSAESPRGCDSFCEWLARHGDELGTAYTSELARNYR